ncbi:MAG: DegQ family serine endoprotease [Mailhella sp.]|nr:DegQ family serine endoprotease [Mailhella sp.]
MRSIFKHAGLAALGVMLMAASAQAELPSFAPLAKKAGPAVVNISTEREVSSPVMDMFNIPGMERFFEQFGGPFGRRGDGQNAPKRKSTALGSGFIISADGYIVTNNHVVEGADKITVNLNGGKGSGLQAKVIGTDADTDLALLKVDGGRDFPTLEFGDSDSMEVGEWVVAIGNPLGLNNTVTAGILSAKGRDLHSGPYDNFLQTDASINPGNSGGPLINMKGEVIGINTAIMANGQGLGFAIPSSLASRIIDDLRAGKKVSRGWLGVAIQDVSEDMAKALGLKNAQGAIIGNVMPGEPADKAGLRAGDVLVRIDGTQVASASEATRKIASLKPGAEAKVTVIRDGDEKSFTVKLGERAASRGSASSPNARGEQIELGLNLRSVTPEDADRLQIASDIKGLLVLDVTPGSRAEAAGLRSGDVILSANQKPVQKPGDLASIVRRDRDRGVIMLLVNRRGETFFTTVSLGKK